ncbi:hypothetical protein THAOC_22485, partial [Thalassiosira oceanica]|jgi:hypothetical protein
LFA